MNDVACFVRKKLKVFQKTTLDLCIHAKIEATQTQTHQYRTFDNLKIKVHGFLKSPQKIPKRRN